jgi:hypothetical protein
MDPAHTQISLLNGDSNYQHITQTQKSALHPAVTVSNNSNSAVSLTIDSNQALSGALVDFNDVQTRVNLTAADSPYTVQATFNKTMYAVSLTAGSVIINLPEVTVANEGRSCAIYVEVESGTNTLTVNTFGAQTIQSRTSHVFQYRRDGFRIITHTFGSNHWDISNWMTDTSSGKANYSEARAGFVEWYGTGAYWSIVGTTFTILRGGRGFIRGNEIIWVAGLTATLASDEYVRMVIDRNGALQKLSAWDVDVQGSDYVSLITVYRDVTGADAITRADYGYDFDHGARVWGSRGFGAVVAPIQYGEALLSRYGTGGGGASIDRQLNISAGGILDGDILETWSAVTTGQIISFAYLTAGGKNALYATQLEVPLFYNSAGTPTALSANNYGVFRIYVVKSNLNSSPPQITAEMHTAQFNNATSAQNAINANTIAGAGTYNPEVAQLGFVVIHNNGGGYIYAITTSKKTLAQYSTGGSTGIASTVNTVTTNFNGALSAADTTVQAALETLDDAVTLQGEGTRLAAATAETTPVDGDLFSFADVSVTNLIKKLTWANLKATLLNTAMTWTGVQTFSSSPIVSISGVAHEKRFIVQSGGTSATINVGTASGTGWCGISVEIIHNQYDGNGSSTFHATAYENAANRAVGTVVTLSTVGTAPTAPSIGWSTRTLTVGINETYSDALVIVRAITRDSTWTWS